MKTTIKIKRTFVIAIHKFYIISINFDVIEKPVEEGFGGALPFTD